MLYLYCVDMCVVYAGRGSLRSKNIVSSAQVSSAVVGASSNIYIWLWVPQVIHAPWFPLRVEVTNNKFDRCQIFKWWQELDAAFEKHDLLTIGHVSDGDE